ncbi:MAG: FecR family protein [Dongiaceae bacterium]
MRRYLLGTAATVLVGGLFAGLPARAETQIGTVAQQEFTGAVGTRETGETQELLHQTDVFANERVDTDDDGNTNLVFLDETNLFVGSQSSVVLDKFVYDPGTQNGDVAISFAKGAFRFVTGQIQNKDNVSLKTPTASMVIRGTQLVIFVLIDGTTEVNVIEGGVDVWVCQETEPVSVNQGQSILITSGCTSSTGSVRAMNDDPIPEMPIELAALDTIAPAAGPGGDDADPDDDVVAPGRQGDGIHEPPEPPSESSGGDGDGQYGG